MDKIEAQNQIKLSQVKIAKLEKKLQKFKEKAKEEFETKLAKYKTTHKKGGVSKYKTLLQRRYRLGADRILKEIRAEKLLIKKCNKTLCAKQVQLDVIEPINIEAELPTIQKNLLASVKGLTLLETGLYLHDNVEYKLIAVENSTRRGSTEVVFQPVKQRRNKNFVEDIEINGEPICCLLYRGYYILRYDGFNNVKHKITKEEEKLYKKYYYNFYYRNRTKIKRQEARESVKHHCSYCHKEFTPLHRSQKFCSKECAKLYRSEELKKEREAKRQENMSQYIKVCPICNKKFVARQQNQIFCSDKCRIKSNNRKIVAKIKAERNMQPTKCLNCGKVFTPNDHRQRHCSSKCRVAYQHKLAKERTLKLLG